MCVRVRGPLVGHVLTAAHGPTDILKAGGLKLETAIIARLARRLTARLNAGDPLAARVKLSKPDFFVAFLFSAGQLA